MHAADNLQLKIETTAGMHPTLNYPPEPTGDAGISNVPTGGERDGAMRSPFGRRTADLKFLGDTLNCCAVCTIED